jgi:hypothetical protein
MFMNKNWVCLINTHKAIGLLMNMDDKVAYIYGFKSKKEGLRYFEDAYNRNHDMSYEASMSACINHIFFQPSIVSLTIEEIKAIGPQKLLRLSHISGFMTILSLPRKAAKPIWDAGAKPKLIS